MTGTVQRFVARYAASGVFSLSVDPCRAEEFGSILERTVQQTLGLSDTSPLFLRDTVLPVVYSTVNGVRTPLARSEVGKSVFYLGPQSGLPYPGSGNSKAGENAVALWRYAGEVTAFAEYYFANVLRPHQSFSTLTPAFVPHELSRTRSTKADDNPLSFPVTAEAEQNPPREMRRLLHYALCETLRGFRLPKTDTPIVFPVTLMLRPAEKAGEPLRLTVQTETTTLAGVSLRPLLSALATEPLVQQAMLAYQETLPVGQRMLGSLPLHLEIRLRGGRCGLHWLSLVPFQAWRDTGREAQEIR